MNEKNLFAVSSTHGLGVEALRESLFQLAQTLDGQNFEDYSHLETMLDPEQETCPKAAIIGMPNAGKSTFLNSFLGKETGRGSRCPRNNRRPCGRSDPYRFRQQRQCSLCHTLGGYGAVSEKKTSVDSFIEEQAVYRSLHCITKSDIVLYLVDAEKGLSRQDKRLFGLVVEKGEVSYHLPQQNGYHPKQTAEPGCSRPLVNGFQALPSVDGFL